MQSETTGDQVAQAISSMFGIAQAGVDWGTAMRAIVEFREDQVERWRDRHAHLVDSPQSDDDDKLAMALEGARMLGIETDQAEAVRLLLTGALAASVLRTGRDWQALLSQLRPCIVQALDDYLADPDPSPSSRDAVVNALSVVLQDIGGFLKDQGTKWEEDIRRLRADLLIGDGPHLSRHLRR